MLDGRFRFLLGSRSHRLRRLDDGLWSNNRRSNHRLVGLLISSDDWARIKALAFAHFMTRSTTTVQGLLHADLLLCIGMDVKVTIRHIIIIFPIDDLNLISAFWQGAEIPTGHVVASSDREWFGELSDGITTLILDIDIVVGFSLSSLAGPLVGHSSSVGVMVEGEEYLLGDGILDVHGGGFMF